MLKRILECLFYDEDCKRAVEEMAKEIEDENFDD